MRKWILFLQISVVSIGTDFWKTLWKVNVLVAQSCRTLCDPIDYSPPASSVHEILQARMLEWAAHSLLQKGEDLQKIFPTQGLNLGLPTLQAFFSIWAIREETVVRAKTWSKSKSLLSRRLCCPVGSLLTTQVTSEHLTCGQVHTKMYGKCKKHTSWQTLAKKTVNYLSSNILM